METLTDKVEAVDLSPIVEFFELYDIFAEGKIGFLEVGDRNRPLVDNANPKNEFAEVFIIFVREDTIEDTGSKAIDVQKQFPGFVTT